MSYPNGLHACDFEYLIHVYWCANTNCSRCLLDAPSMESRMHSRGLIEPAVAPRTGSYQLTDRGEVFVKHILHLQLPVASWKMPIQPSVICD